MRGITITYKYSGPEEMPGAEAMETFIAAINSDSDVAGKFAVPGMQSPMMVKPASTGAAGTARRRLKTAPVARVISANLPGKVKGILQAVSRVNTGADVHFKTERLVRPVCNALAVA